MKTDENRVLGAKPLGEGGVVKTSGLNPGGRLSPLKILFLIFAVVINCLGGIFIPQTAIPLYMDSVLTIAVTACCGLWGGILCVIGMGSLLPERRIHGRPDRRVPVRCL